MPPRRIDQRPDCQSFFRVSEELGYNTINTSCGVVIFRRESVHFGPVSSKTAAEPTPASAGRHGSPGGWHHLSPVVRDAEEDVVIVDDFAQIVDPAVGRRGEELGLQILLHRHVEHDVDGMLAYLSGRVAERMVEIFSVLLELRADDDNVLERARRHHRHVVAQCLAPGRIAQLCLALLVVRRAPGPRPGRTPPSISCRPRCPGRGGCQGGRRRSRRASGVDRRVPDNRRGPADPPPWVRRRGAELRKSTFKT